MVAQEAKAVAEVASLAAQFTSECKAPALKHHRKQMLGHYPHQAKSVYVAVAFAEAKWAEREAEFAKKLAQSVPAEASPCETGEGTSEDYLGEDEAGSKIVKGKRKALLRREQDFLACKVRSSLDKVSSHASPFKKRCAQSSSFLHCCCACQPVWHELHVFILGLLIFLLAGAGVCALVFGAGVDDAWGGHQHGCKRQCGLACLAV